MSLECPICGADSEYSWRCSECSKLFDDGEHSGRGEGVGRR